MLAHLFSPTPISNGRGSYLGLFGLEEPIETLSTGNSVSAASALSFAPFAGTIYDPTLVTSVFFFLAHIVPCIYSTFIGSARLLTESAILLACLWLRVTPCELAHALSDGTARMAPTFPPILGQEDFGFV